MTILLCGAYWLRTTQAETITEVREVEKVVEVILDNYIPLEDIACYFINGYDYPCFESKDVRNQLDNPNNRSYAN